MERKINNILALLIFLSVTIIPSIRFSESLPSVQGLDLLLPFLIARIIVQRAYVGRKLFFITFGFCGIYILFSIFLNELYNAYQDYFEIYKLLKFGVVMLFFSLFKLDKLYNIVFIPTFILLVIFNTLHFYDLFGFNKIVELYYNGGVHIKIFGLNSIGMPVSKRIIGTIGNPNNNALLFAIFAILFYPRNRNDWKFIILFLVALIFFFLCQSRTGLLAFVVVLLITWGVQFVSKNMKIIELKNVIALAMLILAYLFTGAINNNLQKSTHDSKAEVIAEQEAIDSANAIQRAAHRDSYLNTVFDEDVSKTSSMQDRYAVWKMLGEMILDKPVFGHGPNKSYFYANKIYAESEYVLITWRYGVIGVLLYSIFLIYLLVKGFFLRQQRIGMILIQISSLFIIASLTNNPFSSRELMVVLAVFIGLYLKAERDEKMAYDI